MKVDLGIWSKLTSLVVILLALAAVLAVGIWYLPLIKHNERLRKEILILTAQVNRQEEQAKQMDAAILAMRNDPRVVERLARERLSYIKPGETMIRFAESGSGHP